MSKVLKIFLGAFGTAEAVEALRAGLRKGAGSVISRVANAAGSNTVGIAAMSTKGGRGKAPVYVYSGQDQRIWGRVLIGSTKVKIDAETAMDIKTFGRKLMRPQQDFAKTAYGRVTVDLAESPSQDISVIPDDSSPTIHLSDVPSPTVHLDAGVHASPELRLCKNPFKVDLAYDESAAINGVPQTAEHETSFVQSQALTHGFRALSSKALPRARQFGFRPHPSKIASVIAAQKMQRSAASSEHDVSAIPSTTVQSGDDRPADKSDLAFKDPLPKADEGTAVAGSGDAVDKSEITKSVSQIVEDFRKSHFTEAHKPKDTFSGDPFPVSSRTEFHPGVTEYLSERRIEKGQTKDDFKGDPFPEFLETETYPSLAEYLTQRDPANKGGNPGWPFSQVANADGMENAGDYDAWVRRHQETIDKRMNPDAHRNELLAEKAKTEPVAASAGKGGSDDDHDEGSKGSGVSEQVGKDGEKEMVWRPIDIGLFVQEEQAKESVLEPSYSRVLQGPEVAIAVPTSIDPHAKGKGDDHGKSGSSGGGRGSNGGKGSGSSSGAGEKQSRFWDLLDKAFANNYFRAAFATSVFGGGLSTGVYVDGELKQKYRLRKNDGVRISTCEDNEWQPDPIRNDPQLLQWLYENGLRIPAPRDDTGSVRTCSHDDQAFSPYETASSTAKKGDYWSDRKFMDWVHKKLDEGAFRNENVGIEIWSPAPTTSLDYKGTDSTEEPTAAIEELFEIYSNEIRSPGTRYDNRKPSTKTAPRSPPLAPVRLQQRAILPFGTEDAKEGPDFDGTIEMVDVAFRRGSAEGEEYMKRQLLLASEVWDTILKHRYPGVDSPTARRLHARKTIWEPRERALTQEEIDAVSRDATSMASFAMQSPTREPLKWTGSAENDQFIARDSTAPSGLRSRAARKPPSKGASQVDLNPSEEDAPLSPTSEQEQTSFVQSQAFTSGLRHLSRRTISGAAAPARHIVTMRPLPINHISRAKPSGKWVNDLISASDDNKMAFGSTPQMHLEAAMRGVGEPNTYNPPPSGPPFDAELDAIITSILNARKDELVDLEPYRVALRRVYDSDHSKLSGVELWRKMMNVVLTEAENSKHANKNDDEVDVTPTSDTNEENPTQEYVEPPSTANVDFDENIHEILYEDGELEELVASILNERRNSDYDIEDTDISAASEERVKPPSTANVDPRSTGTFGGYPIPPKLWMEKRPMRLDRGAWAAMKKAMDKDAEKPR